MQFISHRKIENFYITIGEIDSIFLMTFLFLNSRTARAEANSQPRHRSGTGRSQVPDAVSSNDSSNPESYLQFIDQQLKRIRNETSNDQDQGSQFSAQSSADPNSLLYQSLLDRGPSKEEADSFIECLKKTDQLSKKMGATKNQNNHGSQHQIQD